MSTATLNDDAVLLATRETTLRLHRIADQLEALNADLQRISDRILRLSRKEAVPAKRVKVQVKVKS